MVNVQNNMDDEAALALLGAYTRDSAMMHDDAVIRLYYISNALDKINVEDRALIILRLGLFGVEPKSLADIAVAVGRSRNSVWLRYTRGMRKIKKRLELQKNLTKRLLLRKSLQVLKVLS